MESTAPEVAGKDMRHTGAKTDGESEEEAAAESAH